MASEEYKTLISSAPWVQKRKIIRDVLEKNGLKGIKEEEISKLDYLEAPGTHVVFIVNYQSKTYFCKISMRLEYLQREIIGSEVARDYLSEPKLIKVSYPTGMLLFEYIPDAISLFKIALEDWNGLMLQKGNISIPIQQCAVALGRELSLFHQMGRREQERILSYPFLGVQLTRARLLRNLDFIYESNKESGTIPGFTESTIGIYDSKADLRKLENAFYSLGTDKEFRKKIVKLADNLEADTKRITVIHGDFGYHQTIYDKSGKAFITDFELFGMGHPSLDIGRFISQMIYLSFSYPERRDIYMGILRNMWKEYAKNITLENRYIIAKYAIQVAGVYLSSDSFIYERPSIQYPVIKDVNSRLTCLTSPQPQRPLRGAWGLLSAP